MSRIATQKLKPKAQRLPHWMRRPFAPVAQYPEVQKLLSTLNLNTVCASAKCPNQKECWSRGTATVMILGDVCTRACRFCAVQTGKGFPPDPDEPARVAQAAEKLGLKHIVITSVTRDDLPDGGAGAFAETLRAVREVNPDIVMEVLTPDFVEHLDTVLEAEPYIFNHNLETVERLQATIRPQASYQRSLETLQWAAKRGRVQVKSGLMLGLGETDTEVFQALEDLYAVGTRLLTLGQYVAPTRQHHPVEHFISPERFDEWAIQARKIGFKGVAAAPLVRSSYRADQLNMN